MLIFFRLFLFLTRAIENSAKFLKKLNPLFFLCNQCRFKTLRRGYSSVLRFTKHNHKYYVYISVHELVCYGLFKICRNGSLRFLVKHRNESLNLSFLALNLPQVISTFLRYFRGLHSLSAKTDRCASISTFKISKNGIKQK